LSTSETRTDEASNGPISFRSPLAQAILGARPGDIIEAGAPLILSTAARLRSTDMKVISQSI
jgi:transcription elongation GreA/GreB family factor